MLYEAKLYVFLITLSCLFLMIREKVSNKVLITYFLASIFGVKTISCLIIGKCYYEVYYFLIGYGLINLAFVLYYNELHHIVPQFMDSIKNKRNNKLKSNSSLQKLESNIENKIRKKNIEKLSPA